MGNLRNQTESQIISAQSIIMKTIYVKAEIDNTQWDLICNDLHETVNYRISKYLKSAHKKVKDKTIWWDQLRIMQENEI